jgi:hypothetical protein
MGAVHGLIAVSLGLLAALPAAVPSASAASMRSNAVASDCRALGYTIFRRWNVSCSRAKRVVRLIEGGGKSSSWICREGQYSHAVQCKYYRGAAGGIGGSYSASKSFYYR